MLRITVDFVPFGIESNKEEIGVLEIGNTGNVNEYNEHEYTYNAKWTEKGEERVRKTSGRVAHDRRNSWWFLLYKIVVKIIKPFHYNY